MSGSDRPFWGIFRSRRSRAAVALLALLAFATVALAAGANAEGAAGPRGPSFKLVGKWGKTGTDNGEFSAGVRGIATDKAGNVYVADTDNHRIQVFTSKGKFLRTWGSIGTGINQFNVARDVAIAPDGTVWVADQQNVQLKQFTPEGTSLVTGIQIPVTELPRGVAVTPTGEVLAAVEGGGYGGFRKYVKGASGWQEDTSGPFGFGPYATLDVEAASDGTVYLDTQTNDPVTAHVHRFTADGEPLGSFALPYPSPGLGVDLDCNVWATDPTRRWIVKYSPTGKVLATASVPDLVANDVAVGPTGDLYVVWQNTGIVHFAQDRSKPAKAAISGFNVFAVDPPADWRAHVKFKAAGIACPSEIEGKVTLTGISLKTFHASADVKVEAGKTTEIEIPLRPDEVMQKAMGTTVTATLKIVLKTNGRPTTQTARVRFVVPKYCCL